MKKEQSGQRGICMHSLFLFVLGAPYLLEEGRTQVEAKVGKTLEGECYQPNLCFLLQPSTKATLRNSQAISGWLLAYLAMLAIRALLDPRYMQKLMKIHVEINEVCQRLFGEED